VYQTYEMFLNGCDVMVTVGARLCEPHLVITDIRCDLAG
jgi:hypothetical protein